MNINLNINDQFIIFSMFWVFSFIVIRWTLWGVKELYLSRNEQKKRAKGQTFKEWLFYSRYKLEIPTVMFVLYYLVLILHPVVFLCICVAAFVEPFQETTCMLTIIMLWFDVIWSFLTFIVSWKPGDSKIHYEYWVPKPPKKRKNEVVGIL